MVTSDSCSIAWVSVKRRDVGFVVYVYCVWRGDCASFSQCSVGTRTGPSIHDVLAVLVLVQGALRTMSEWMLSTVASCSIQSGDVEPCLRRKNSS